MEHICIWNNPMVNWSQMSWLCALPNSHPPGMVWEAEKSLMLCKHCSEIVKTLVCYHHCSSTNPKQPHRSHCEENQQPKPAHPADTAVMALDLLLCLCTELGTMMIQGHNTLLEFSGMCMCILRKGLFNLVLWVFIPNLPFNLLRIFFMRVSVGVPC